MNTSDRSSSPDLASLLSVERLHLLTDNNDKMLHALLSMTLQSNISDLQLAKDLFEQHAWDELAKTIHRLSGAAQITGAQRTEIACRHLETACLVTPPEIAHLARLWAEANLALNEFNRAIAAFLDPQ